MHGTAVSLILVFVRFLICGLFGTKRIHNYTAARCRLDCDLAFLGILGRAVGVVKSNRFGRTVRDASCSRRDARRTDDQLEAPLFFFFFTHFWVLCKPPRHTPPCTRVGKKGHMLVGGRAEEGLKTFVCAGKRGKSPNAAVSRSFFLFFVSDLCFALSNPHVRGNVPVHHAHKRGPASQEAGTRAKGGAGCQKRGAAALAEK